MSDDTSAQVLHSLSRDEDVRWLAEQADKTLDPALATDIRRLGIQVDEPYYLMSDRFREVVHRLLAERDVLLAEHEAGSAILRAIRVMGPRPDIHIRAVDWLIKHWPTLWDALTSWALLHDAVERLRKEGK